MAGVVDDQVHVSDPAEVEVVAALGQDQLPGRPQPEALEQAAYAGVGGVDEEVVAELEIGEGHRVDLVDALANAAVALPEARGAARRERAVEALLGDEPDEFQLDGLDALLVEAGVQPVELVQVGLEGEPAGRPEAGEVGREVPGQRDHVLDPALLAPGGGDRDVGERLDVRRQTVTAEQHRIAARGVRHRVPVVVLTTCNWVSFSKLYARSISLAIRIARHR